MAWIFLVFAGLLEVFWSTCLKLSHGFSVMRFTVLTIIGMIFSFLFLAQATKTLPLGTSYAVWTGIGALGAVIIGIILFKESASPTRLVFVAFLDLPYPLRYCGRLQAKPVVVHCPANACSCKHGSRLPGVSHI